MGCLAAAKIRLAFSMPTISSVGEWKTSSALRKLRDLLQQHVLGKIVDEGAADGELPAGKDDLDLALAR